MILKYLRICFSLFSTMKKHGYLLFEGACFGILCHYIMQRLNADVDDATELVLDHTSNTQTTQAHFLLIQQLCLCVCLSERDGYLFKAANAY